MFDFDEKMKKAVNNVYDTCFNLKNNEKVLVVSDEGCIGVALPFWYLALNKTQNCLFVLMKKMSVSGEEPPEEVSEIMTKNDILLLITSMSLSHTEATRRAIKNGARVASMPDITEDIVRRTLTADYSAIRKRSITLAEELRDAKSVRIISGNGEVLTFSVEGRRFNADTGIIDKPGKFSNLPAGEVYSAPVENTADGVVIIDGVIPEAGNVDKPVRMEFRDGYLTSMDGGRAVDVVMKTLNRYGRNERNLAEIGIGTNDKATLVPNIIEAEKVMGTIHIAIGDNKSMGGKVSANIHLDFVIKNCILEIDNRVIVENGKLLI
ncbi:MAG: hypothetical protein B6D57_04540 [Candidatus Coatesbacteria bacterium 4484_99]|uniref:Leucyl aminopeptidase n=1 Tax=Candidatus Coatesbacteria bacterium 4484_99 TaxID=1970774 RepID=A0A1W9S0K4_9BACT|nr:MAG: hypothetical protein B6D57_04540 [Candidatus Coatesbacteria bacterium 4484_99]RLC41673.1 MAG: aminopeptidase [Candidatus Coatesbacteria bacterium]RLC41767.1 MAG: aminopeptidase [Candidatus Coatesbacteria bacterium]RLC43079.1 MAG: aminopeptidase [Candidatus Coatesbacteria bacterium]